MTDIPDEFCEFACPACGAVADRITELGQATSGDTVYKCNYCKYVWTAKETEGDDK